MFERLPVELVVRYVIPYLSAQDIGRLSQVELRYRKLLLQLSYIQVSRHIRDVMKEEYTWQLIIAYKFGRTVKLNPNETYRQRYISLAKATKALTQKALAKRTNSLDNDLGEDDSAWN